MAHPALYRPLDTPRLHERVVRQIVRRIVSGAVAPGSILPTEPELARQFDVSRTVIREAARVLGTMGLVTVKHGSGMRVQPPESWDHLDPLILVERARTGQDGRLFDEVLEVRRIVEVEAAGLAAERRSDEDLCAMRETVEGMHRALDDPDAYIRLDVQFHYAILTAARNRLLREVVRPAFQFSEAGRRISIRRPGAVIESLRGHEQIFAAIGRGDAEAARAAMRRHIFQFEGDIRAGLQLEGVTPRSEGSG